ncbi:hypothetical protein B0I35DRAFT_477215 [Stachybotrys elegans]|uniref:Tat pathway signal sequence n=1 Tax=Stachybotrys elegans TaxID=80388 RepID=A0A8K0STX2_9HYPO|nr:hypothetical protein B0I35DRAFT_477215 [Stachybotrys elegans]
MENREKYSSESTESHEPLLEGPLLTSQHTSTASNRWRRVLLGVLLAYTLVSCPILIWQIVSRVPQPYSPANEAISYRRKQLYFGEDPVFMGHTDEVDEAWQKLLEPLNIRTSLEEQQKAHADINTEMVQPSGGGYVSVLSVYHELHCLDSLRASLMPDRYYQNATEDSKTFRLFHLSHCIDTIRRSLMCKADPSIYTAYWIGDHTADPNKELRSKSDTVCINWEALDGWARKRLLPSGYKVKAGPFEKPHKSPVSTDTSLP